jgi:hypothetical protein
MATEIVRTIRIWNRCSEQDDGVPASGFSGTSFSPARPGELGYVYSGSYGSVIGWERAGNTMIMVSHYQGNTAALER